MGGKEPVLWGLCLITATIAGVIVQRMTDSMVLAEGTFITTALLVLQGEQAPCEHPPTEEVVKLQVSDIRDVVVDIDR